MELSWLIGLGSKRENRLSLIKSSRLEKKEEKRKSIMILAPVLGTATTPTTPECWTFKPGKELGPLVRLLHHSNKPSSANGSVGPRCMSLVSYYARLVWDKDMV